LQRKGFPHEIIKKTLETLKNESINQEM